MKLGETRTKPSSTRNPVEASEIAINNIKSRSTFLKQEDVDDLPRFLFTEFKLGSLLGRGGFSDVYEITSIELDDNNFAQFEDKNNNSSTTTDSSKEKKKAHIFDKPKRKFVVNSYIRDNGEARYCLKHLQINIINNRFIYAQGAADIATETYFLASIQHPNIIKIRGVCANGIQGFTDYREGNYFIVIDRLYDTLETKLSHWAKEKKMYKSWKKRLHKIDYAAFVAERLRAAFDLSSALDYLHTRHIVYRDLKPENIGFDIRGDIKLFDFGLAVELPQDQNTYNESFEMSGNVGSRLYMAPEVALGKPYNLKADVYSFAMVLWRMMSCKPLFAKYEFEQHEEKVIRNGERLRLKKSWGGVVNDVISKGWDENPAVRLNFETITLKLLQRVKELRAGDDSGLNHQERRSTHFFEGWFSNRSKGRQFSVSSLNLLNKF